MVGEIPIMHYFASLRFNNVSAMISQPESLANVGKRIKCFGWQTAQAGVLDFELMPYFDKKWWYWCFGNQQHGRKKIFRQKVQ